jgi:hypothetical protein
MAKIALRYGGAASGADNRVAYRTFLEGDVLEPRREGWGHSDQRRTPIRASVRLVRWSSIGAFTTRRPASLACHTKEEQHGRF